MSDANLDHTDLSAVGYGGLVHEDVMNKIWDISKIPLPLTDRIGTDSADNQRKEWTTDRLMDPDVANAHADGAVAPTVVTNPAIADGAALSDGEPARQGNQCQISVKAVEVSTRARNVNTIGRSDELGYQVMMRQRELRRDVEAIMLTHQASVVGDANTPTAGKSGGLGSWIKTTALSPGTIGTAPGYDASTGLTVAPIISATGALTETLVRDACEGVFNEGGDPSIFMSIPTVVRKFSEFLFTSSARIATLTSQSGGQGEQPLTAQGSVNVFVTDFGIVLDLVPNRIQQAEVVTGGSEEASAYIIDPAYLSQAFLHGYKTEPLAKVGLSDRRMMSVDWTLIVNNQRAHASILGIDYLEAVTA